MIDMGGLPVDLAARVEPLPNSTMRARTLGVSKVITVWPPIALTTRLDLPMPAATRSGARPAHACRQPTATTSRYWLCMAMGRLA